MIVMYKMKSLNPAKFILFAETNENQLAGELERQGLEGDMNSDQWSELDDLGSVMIAPTPKHVFLIIRVVG